MLILRFRKHAGHDSAERAPKGSDCEIGDNVEVGANAVVTRDVPAESAVLAPPCRAVPMRTVLACHGKGGGADRSGTSDGKEA